MKIDRFTNKLKRAIKGSLYRNDNLITYIEVSNMLKENPNGILIDVRSIQEYNEYHLNGAICLPYYDIENKIATLIENKNTLIIVYCQSGGRSKKAYNILKKMGYTNVYQLDGGIDNI